MQGSCCPGSSSVRSSGCDTPHRAECQSVIPPLLPDFRHDRPDILHSLSVHSCRGLCDRLCSQIDHAAVAVALPSVKMHWREDDRPYRSSHCCGPEVRYLAARSRHRSGGGLSWYDRSHRLRCTLANPLYKAGTPQQLLRPLPKDRNGPVSGLLSRTSGHDIPHRLSPGVSEHPALWGNRASVPPSVCGTDHLLSGTGVVKSVLLTWQ